MAATSPALAAHAWLFTGSWETGTGNRAIAEAGRYGYAAIEIPIVHPTTIDAQSHRVDLSRAGIAALCRATLPAALDMARTPERAHAHLRRVVETTAAMESRLLVGALAWSPGSLAAAPPTRAERAIVVEVLAELALEAGRHGVTLALEPGNRYETHLFTTVAESAATVLAVASPHLKLAVDTRTMQMEESSLRGAILGAADLLAHVTIRESHGGEAGTGTIAWDEVWQALAQIGFDGWMVYRCDAGFGFGADGPPDAQVWRSDLRPSMSVASSGLGFLREGLKRMLARPTEPAAAEDNLISPATPQEPPARKPATRRQPAKPRKPQSPAPLPGENRPRTPSTGKKNTSTKAPTGKSYRARPSR